MLKDEVAVVTPTHGARRADQAVIDSVLPRKSFKPEITVHTTFTGFGIGINEGWVAEKVVDKIRTRNASQAATDTYGKDTIILDEAAQTFYDQLDMADAVGHELRGGAVQRFVLILDGVQTPPVIDKATRAGSADEMIWEGNWYLSCSE